MQRFGGRDGARPSVGTGTVALGIGASGAARASLAAIGGMRKRLPNWAPRETSGHFLKYADEQTVLAVAAVDEALSRDPSLGKRCQNWAVIAAPRWIGRLGAAAALDRYGRSGAPSVSPHLVPQHSLHSVSGAVSILLGTRGPNYGVGGGASALAEGLLAAVTLGLGNYGGVWLLATAWEPEPQLDQSGNCTNAPICYAAALALESRAEGQMCGRLTLSLLGSGFGAQDMPTDAARTADPTIALAESIGDGSSAMFSLRTAGGLSLTLEIHSPAGHRLAAA